MHRVRHLSPFTLLAIIAVLVFSLSGGGARDAVAEGQALSERGKALFQHYCSHCHGNGGAGDGYNAEHLDKEPADLSDGEFLGKKTDDQIFRVIHDGGAGVRKSHLMPMFGATLSEEEIWTLVAYARKLSGGGVVQMPEGVGRERSSTPKLNREMLLASGKDEASKETLALGEKLFNKKKSCLACHEIEEEGGHVGPDLSRAGRLYPRLWLLAWLQNPQMFAPVTRMPNMALKPTEAQAIAAYLGSRQGDAFPREWGEYLRAKGDAERGRKIFFDPDGKAYCSKCHRIEGEGGQVGPDLSWIGSKRTREFLLESVINPKAVITSGYATMMILTKDRKFITGIKKSEDDTSFTLLDKDGVEQTIPKDTIKKFKTQKISTMPANFQELLKVEEVADLLAFLETRQHPLFQEPASP